MNGVLDSAISYRRRGLSVIPIKSKDKKPLIAWEPYQKEPASEGTIKDWFESWPNANVGIVTGAVSDVVVIDLDSAEAKEKIKTLVPNYDLSAVPRVRTGRGGYHLFFKHPGVSVQTRVGVLPKTDVRADGGYVVAAPSIHENGKLYTWEVSVSGELPKLPLELFKLISSPSGNSNGYRERFNTASALAGVSEGQRDQTLFKLACKLRSADVPQDMAETLLSEAARNCKPPFDEETALEKVHRVYSNSSYEPKGQSKQAEIWPEFLSAEQILDEPDDPQAYRWHECLPTAGSAILVAPPKIGKTTLAANLGLAIARGVPFLGRATQQCAVAYAYLDGPAREIKDVFKGLGLKRTDRVFISSGPAPNDYVKWIMAQVEESAVKFIVLDTFQKFFRIDNINDYSEVVNKSAPMLDAAAAKDVHLLFLHHAGKGDRGDLDSAIGSTALRGQVQSYLHLKILPDSNRRIFRSDQRHGQGNFPEVQIGFDRLGWLEIKGSREDAEIQDAKPKVREVLESEDGEMTEKQIRAATTGRGIIVSKAMREMLKAGEVERTGEGKKNRPFRYSLAPTLVARDQSPMDHSDGLPVGGILKGGFVSQNDSCPILTIKESSIPGHESKTDTEICEKTKNNSSPGNSGHERDTHGHEFFSEGSGLESESADDWEEWRR
jgi:Bifunctional DNA primase/polymerase, N-terminal/AAA domain/Primase C terminal 1 (PriCT-1)